MMSDWLASPDDSELEELDHFLRAHAGEEDMLLDGVHGFLTALAIGPAPAKPEEWLPEILHAPFADAEEGERVLTLLARLNDAITPELETGSYEPILGELDGEEGGLQGAGSSSHDSACDPLAGERGPQLHHGVGIQGAVLAQLLVDLRLA